MRAAGGGGVTAIKEDTNMNSTITIDIQAAPISPDVIANRRAEVTQQLARIERRGRLLQVCGYAIGIGGPIAACYGISRRSRL